MYTRRVQVEKNDVGGSGDISMSNAASLFMDQMGRIISFIAMIYFIVVPVCTAFAAAPSVIVVKSADIAPYNEAVASFEKNCRCNIRELSLTEIDENTLLQEIRVEAPALILTVGVDALMRVSSITNLPIVYSMVPSSSLTRAAGKNVSGVSMHVSPEKYLSALIDLFPEAKRIGIVYDPKNLDAFVKEAEQIARRKGVELVLREVQRAGDFPSSIDSLERKIDLFWMLPDGTVVNAETFKYLLGFSFRTRVPVFTFSRKYVENGAATGLFTLPADIGAQAGEMARQILTDKALKTPHRADARKAAVMVNDRILQKLGVTVNNEAARRALHVQ